MDKNVYVQSVCVCINIYIGHLAGLVDPNQTDY